MALPADFSKIFGSTATGGLTPIGDVNYAKGWEFVGSNPPTKNDFSYLQNLSDLKSQWLYSNKLQRTDPFGDIKSDGAAAVSTALANLGLREAAKRDVGTGENQIPDMSSFAINIIDGTTVVLKFPNGLIVQTGQLTITGQTATLTFPVPFPTKVMAVAGLNFNSAFSTPASVASYAIYWSGDGRTAVSIGASQNGKAFRYLAIGY